MKSFGKSFGKIQLPPRVRDIRGMRSGLLTAISYTRTEDRKSMWRCICACGCEKELSGSAVSLHLTESCGCLRLVCSSSHGVVPRTSPEAKEMTERYRSEMLAHPVWTPEQKAEVEEALAYRSWYESEGRKPSRRKVEEARPPKYNVKPFDWTEEMCPSQYDDKNFY